MNVVEILADDLAESAWKDKQLWPGLDTDSNGRPLGKDIEASKLQLATAIQTIYEDWLEANNHEAYYS